MAAPIDARNALLALAARQHHVVTRRQATDVGFGHRRVAAALRAGWLTEPLPRVLNLTGVEGSWEQRLMTVLLAGGSHAVASHRSAARLLGLDGFDAAGNAVVEVSVSRAFRLAPATRAVVHHVTPLAPCDLTSIRGIRCTTMPRTLADLGAVVPSRGLRRALTSARRKGIDLGRTRAVARRLHRPGQSGTGALLRLLDSVPWEGSVPDTWFEELLQLCLDDPALPPIVPQFEINDRTGTVVARTDLGIPSVRLGLEAHSRRFHFGPEAEALDEDRDVRAAMAGWELLYLGWYATRRPADVLRVVKEVVRARQRELRTGCSTEL